VLTHRTAGRSLVTRRAIADVVRAAALGSYGVTGFASNPVMRLAARLGLGQPGLRVALADGLAVDLRLTVAYGVPVAEVARQVDSAVRYAVRRTVGREIERLRIHVGGLEYQPGGPPPTIGAAPSTAVATELVAAAVAPGGDTVARPQPVPRPQR
jgi:uncharacterized alkaline shock family protein YloU